MDATQINELKESYYEYITKVPQGLQLIINLLAKNELATALNSIADLAEGLEFLLKIEQALKNHNFQINSRIEEVLEIYNEINNSLVNEDYILLKDLVEYELIPVFSSASEWIFQAEVK